MKYEIFGDIKYSIAQLSEELQGNLRKVLTNKQKIINKFSSSLG